MFSLISGFYNVLITKPQQSILIIGLDHAGKSTMLEYMKGRYGKQASLPPERITPTVGMNIAKFDFGGSQIMLWDLGGQMKMRGMWEQYYEDADGVIFILDSADPSRFHEAKQAFDRVRGDDKLAHVPIVIFANKQDMPGAQTVLSLGAEFHCDNACKIFSVSGLTGMGVDEALTSLLNSINYALNVGMGI